MKKVTFVKSRAKSIFHAESHSRGFWKRGAPNAGMNVRTLLECGGAFSQHFPHGAKTGAHFFGAKIAVGSREWAVGSRFQGRNTRARRSGVSFEHPFVLKQDAVFTVTFFNHEGTKDTKILGIVLCAIASCCGVVWLCVVG